MDKNTIYGKTREGDEAVRQRTRLGRRVLRSTLIMVDGHATVAELVKRFGDDAAIESALAELEHGGLVERVLPPVGPEIVPAARADIIAAPSETEAQLEDIPVLTARLVEPSPQMAAPALAPVVEEIVIDASEYYSLPPLGAPETARTLKRVAAETGTDWAAKLKGVLAGLAARRAERRKVGRQAQEDGEGSVPAVSVKPIRRGRRFPVSMTLLAAILVVVTLVLALVAVFFPYDRYLPDVERQASAALNEPVKVGRLGVSFLPHPSITLEGIEVGKERHLSVGSARIVPDILSLFGERKVIRDFHLDGVTVKGQGLGRIAQWGGAGSAMEIRHVTVAALSLEVGDVVVEGVSGEVQMGAGGAPEKILLRNADGSLRVEAWPNGSTTYKVAVLGNAWTAPFQPRLVFDYFDAEGELGPSRLDLSRFEGKLYNGLIAGVGSIDWSASAVLAGEIEFKRLNLAKLLPALNTGMAAEGELIGTVRLDAKADSLGKLGDALRASAVFDIGRGAIRGLDLVEAVRTAGRDPTRGGATKFEQFSGSLQFDQQAYRLTNLRVSSGLMKANGNVNLSPEKRLSGVMEVELKGTAALLRVPVSIAGTTQAPLLMAGKR